MATITKQKEVKVVSISSNTNSFGLFGVILMAKDGETYQVGASQINLPKKDEVLRNNIHYNESTQERILKSLSWSWHGFEVPERLTDAPNEIITEVWGSALVMDERDKTGNSTNW